MVYLEEKRHIQQHQHLVSEGVDYAAAIDHRIDEAFYSLYALSFVIQQSEGDLKDFDQTAEQLTRYNGYINQVGMAPNGVISEVTRRDGQSTHLQLGLNLFNEESFANAASLAKEKNSIVMTALLHSHDAQPYVIGLLPVHIKNRKGESAFWGFALIAIDFRQLLQSPPILKRTF
jgi:sensor domain CHASE-containing protein